MGTVCIDGEGTDGGVSWELQKVLRGFLAGPPAGGREIAPADARRSGGKLPGSAIKRGRALAGGAQG
jgi:hypothetical protein